MHDAASPCPDCGTLFDTTDNYCRNCGMYLAALRGPLPVPAENVTRAVEVPRPAVPAPVRKAATALAIGAALQVGVGLAGRYLAGQAAREAGRAAAGAAAQGARKPIRRTESQPPRVQEGETAAISETVIVRRVWVRRG